MRPMSFRTRLAVLLLLAVGAVLPPPLAAALGRWSPLGPEGGTVFALAFAPSDPQRVYAALDSGGVFRSGNGGVTWTAPRGMMAGQIVYSLAVDPANSSIAYAGTPDGVWKTASGGAAWTVFPDHLAGVQVFHLVVDPSRPQTVFAGTNQGVFRSDDGGRSWAPADQGLPPFIPAIGQGQVTALDVDPGPPSRLFTTIQEQNGLTEIFASTDHGVTWTQMNGPEPGGIRQVSGFVWDRTAHTLFLNAWPFNLDQSTRPSLWKTSDGGVTWSRLTLPGRLAGNDVRLAVDASGALYAASAGVWKSADGGLHWSEVGAVDVGGEPGYFAFVLALAADPSRAGRLLAGSSDLGIFESTGGAWRAVNDGLTATAATGLEIFSTPRRRVLYAAAFGGGVFLSRDGGAQWTPSSQGLDGGFFPYYLVNSLALDPRRPSWLYAGVFGGVARSTDGAAHWTIHPVNDCVSVSILAVDPESNTLYAGGSGTSAPCSRPCFAYLSHDAGQIWACMPGVISQVTTAAAVDPLNTAVVYVGVDQGLYKSIDRGASFVRSDRGGLDSQIVLALAISPAAHRVIYAGTTGGVYKSTDAGKNWSRMGLTSVSALAVDPKDARIVYAGSLGRGVFQSVNGGATWAPLNDGLPAIAFSGPLRLDPRTRTLYAGTSGSGLWAITLP